MVSSPVDASTIVITYADTFPISEGTGPSPARRYCPVPPSTFGIILLSSAKLIAINIFRIITTNKGRINAFPASPIPVPSDTRQLVATISPTVTEIPSKSDNFFIICLLLYCFFCLWTKRARTLCVLALTYLLLQPKDIILQNRYGSSQSLSSVPIPLTFA